MKLNLLVLRTAKIDVLSTQYERLGFQFTYHRHGKGPFHFAAELEGLVLEIYPLMSSMEKADASLRLDFEVEELATKLDAIRESNWKILTPITPSQWGLRAVIQDLDGRKIELVERRV